MNVVFNKNGMIAASTLDPSHGKPLMEEEVQMLTEYRINSSTRAREATQNVELMLEINSEGYKHRNSEANNRTVTIPYSEADLEAIPEVSIQLQILANNESEAETDESEAKTEQAKINKQLQIENNTASNKN